MLKLRQALARLERDTAEASMSATPEREARLAALQSDRDRLARALGGLEAERVAEAQEAQEARERENARVSDEAQQQELRAVQEMIATADVQLPLDAASALALLAAAAERAMNARPPLRVEARAALTRLGEAHLLGQGSPADPPASDFARAAAHFEQAAALGCAEAQHRLAFMSANGLGLPHDPARAVSFRPRPRRPPRRLSTPPPRRTFPFPISSLRP
jgi:TPR repeat protein